MKAVIMAGGEGTRLRPITCSMPKPLVPLCTKPVLAYILDLLAEHGCTDATLTLMYLGKQIESYFAEEEYPGIRLHYAYEETPLGTAGSVKNAVPAVDEPLLIISGDAMCDFDLSAALAFHREKGAAATLVVKRVKDPREYGLVSVGADGKIAGFVEKPPLSHCVTDLANTGVYILSPQVLERIEPGKKNDFASDVFPAMLADGLPLYAYEDKGYWCDIGDIDSYQRCQKDMLEGKVRCRIPAKNQNGIYCNSDLSRYQCKIIPPAFIGENVDIGSGTLIAEGTVIGDHAVIGRDCKVRGSILHDCCYLGDRVTCNEAVVCADARLLRDSAAYEHAVLGEGAMLGEDSRLLGGIKLWNKKETASGLTVGDDVKYGSAKSIVIDDDGISGETNVTVTPELAAKIGASLGSLKAGGTVGVACNFTKSGTALKQALIAGAVAAGANVLDFGEAAETEYEFCLNRTKADFGAYLDSNIITNIFLSDRCGIPMMRSMERKLENAVNRGAYKKAAWNDFGMTLWMGELKKLYQLSLLQTISGDLQGMAARVKSSSSRVKELLEDTLKRLGCGRREGIILNLTADGRQVSVYTEETGYLFHEKALCLVCLSEFMDGRDVVVPYDAPSVLEDMAARYGRKVLRYYASPCDRSDSEARKAAEETLFLNDGLVLSVKLLSFLKRRGMTLREALRLLPQFERSTRLIGVKGSTAAVMKALCPQEQAIGEGVSIRTEDGNMLIKPMKSGKGIFLFAESVRSETAEELCDLFERRIRDQEQNA